MSIDNDEPKPEMITAEFREGHKEQIEQASDRVGIDMDTFIRAATMKAVREVQDTGEIAFGRPCYKYRRLTGVHGPNGGIFVSFEMNATVYQLIEQLLFKYGMIPSIQMEHVAAVQLMKVIDTLDDQEQLMRLVDRDSDTLSDFIKRYTEFADANPNHAIRVEELLKEFKQGDNAA